eukprot:4283658-Pyramimonas_sp.AAC.1
MADLSFRGVAVVWARGVEVVEPLVVVQARADGTLDVLTYSPADMGARAHAVDRRRDGLQERHDVDVLAVNIPLLQIRAQADSLDAVGPHAALLEDAQVEATAVYLHVERASVAKDLTEGDSPDVLEVERYRRSPTHRYLQHCPDDQLGRGL